MYFSTAVVAAALAGQISAHGVITMVMGANGVNMPGLSTMDGTPRDCPTPNCGSEKDTAIMRNGEMGTNRATALGRTNGYGAINGPAAVAAFMGNGTASAAPAAKRGLLDGLTGGAGGGAGGGLGGLLGGGGGGGGGAMTASAMATGTMTPKGTTENKVAASAGMGAMSGLPTTDNQGTVTMNFHQVNQDGAGPLTAMMDATSGGSNPQSFQMAQVMADVPGIGIGGLSGAQTMDFPVKVAMPAGMMCQGQVGGADNVCVVKMMNAALAGPFGGSGAFTQSAGAAKRAMEYNLKKRHFARGTLAQDEE